MRHVSSLAIVGIRSNGNSGGRTALFHAGRAVGRDDVSVIARVNAALRVFAPCCAGVGYNRTVFAILSAYCPPYLIQGMAEHTRHPEPDIHHTDSTRSPARHTRIPP